MSEELDRLTAEVVANRLEGIEYPDNCIEHLLGKTLSAVVATDDTVKFTTVQGKEFLLYHEQDCCEHVYVESIVGDLDDLVGEPILQAEETQNGNTEPVDDFGNESYTWTFYKLATRKGYVTIRFYGSSNGYYSESVDFRPL